MYIYHCPKYHIGYFLASTLEENKDLEFWINGHALLKQTRASLILSEVQWKCFRKEVERICHVFQVFQIKNRFLAYFCPSGIWGSRFLARLLARLKEKFGTQNQLLCNENADFVFVDYSSSLFTILIVPILNAFPHVVQHKLFVDKLCNPIVFELVIFNREQKSDTIKTWVFSKISRVHFARLSILWADYETTARFVRSMRYHANIVDIAL